MTFARSALALVAAAFLSVALWYSARADSRSVAAKAFRDCASCPQMVSIPAGSFVMGAPKSEQDSDDMERPQVRVTVRGFALGKFPVTRAEYAMFVQETRRRSLPGCSWTARATSDPDKVSTWEDTGFPQSDRSPVVCVTWDDVTAYIGWLRQKTGKPYRLPSEAEWEYAARAGSTTAFPWGGKASHEFANYGDENWGPLASGRDQWKYTSPVGSFPPNHFGLYDMHGNVLEFVADCFSSDYRRLPRDGSPFRISETMTSNPMKELNGRNSCSLHMLRGGDWGDPGSMIRSAARNFGPPPPSERSGGVGFRVALSVRK
jgi:formylglycine-generating enzyme required for sulfatase activity